MRVAASSGRDRFFGRHPGRDEVRRQHRAGAPDSRLAVHDDLTALVELLADERDEGVRLTRGRRVEVGDRDVPGNQPVLAHHLRRQPRLVERHDGGEPARPELVEGQAQAAPVAGVSHARELPVQHVAEVVEAVGVGVQAVEERLDRGGDLDVDLSRPDGVAGHVEEVGDVVEVDDVHLERAGADRVPVGVREAADQQLASAGGSVVEDRGDAGLVPEQRGQPDRVEAVLGGHRSAERAQRLPDQEHPLGAVGTWPSVARTWSQTQARTGIGVAQVVGLVPPDLLHRPAVVDQALPGELEQRVRGGVARSGRDHGHLRSTGRRRGPSGLASRRKVRSCSSCCQRSLWSRVVVPVARGHRGRSLSLCHGGDRVRRNLDPTMRTVPAAAEPYPRGHR